MHDKKFTFIFLGLVSIMLSVQVEAAVNAYTFSNSSGTYTEITGGTIVATATVGGTGTASLDDVTYTLASGTLPFSFSFNGSTYTGFFLNTNGFISFGTTAPATTTYSAISSTIIADGIITAINGDLQGITTAGSLGELRYEIVGSAPNRIFVIQWKNFRHYGASGETYNFQIRLGENGNTVNVVYGPVTKNTTSRTYQVGLRGTSNSDYFNRETTTNWAATTQGGSATASCTMTSTIFPANGLTFTYTPPAVTYPILSFQPWWATVAGSFTSGGSQVYICPMVAGISYNFSICSTDGSGGTYSGSSDGDFTLFSDAALTTQVWYIDGNAGCSYNASTLGSAYENYAPPVSQNYYLRVDDYSGGSGNFTLAYQGRFVSPADFDGTCQTFSVPTFGAGGGVYHQFYLNNLSSYNFSTCSSDACGGAAPSNDADFTLYSASGTQMWYVDGTSGCGYDASTYNSIYQDYIPPANGYYYLFIDDYYNAAGSGIVLDYSGVSGPQPGDWTGLVNSDWNNTGNWADGNIPTSTVSVTIPAGCPNYPDINISAGCDFLTLNAGASLIVNYGGTLTVANNVINNGTITNYGDFLITGDYNSETTAIMNQLDGNWAMYWFTNSSFWGDGTLVATGGNIYTAEAVLAAYTTMTFNGPFNWFIGQVARWNAANFTANPSGGNVILTGYNLQTLVPYTDCFIFPPSSPETMCFFDLTINTSPATNNIFMVGSFGASGHQVFGDLNIQGGHVRTDNTFFNSFIDVYMDLYVAANNDADLSVASATAFTVGGQTWQNLKSAAGYGSITGPINHTGQFNFTTEIEGLTSGKWELISPPVSNATAGTFLCQYLMSHDPASNTWNDMVDPSTILNPGYDYALWVHPNTMTGNIPCSTIPPNTTFTWSGTRNPWSPLSISLGDGWNNVGNPYTATIDWDHPGWTKTNLNNAIYFENNGTWSGYSGGISYNGGTQYIAPNQGFFVESPGGGSLGFDVTTASHTRTSFFKNEVSKLLRIVANGNGRTDETVIRISDEATTGFDPAFDAHKLFNNPVEFPQVPQIYSMDNNYLAVNALDVADLVALGFRAGLAGSYTISQTDATDFSNVILEDLVTGTFTDLLASSYNFAYNPGENEARFIVHFTPLAVENNLAENLSVYAYGQVVYVSVPENVLGDIQVYNMVGQLVASKRMNNTLNNITLPADASYIIKVTTSNIVNTYKIVTQ